MNVKALFVHAMTPLHPGTGQGVGVIDLPVAREVATGLPYLPGSSLKGVLRDRADGSLVDAIFGPPTENASDHAGAALFTDQRLLLLPVRSLAGTFAWVTSPYVLQRFRRDMQVIVGLDKLPHSVSVAAVETAFVVKGSALTINVENVDQLVLEDINLEPKRHKNTRLWAEWIASVLFPGDDAWKATLSAHFCIVHDDVFSFLLETATEIIARNRLLDDKKTVAKGGLWYEEALPAETILYGMVLAQEIKKLPQTPAGVLSEVAKLTAAPVQLGGHGSIGRGLCRLSMTH